MKKPKNYRPKYSLSLKYLERILSKKELKELLDNYVAEKVRYWDGYKGRSKK